MKRNGEPVKQHSSPGSPGEKIRRGALISRRILWVVLFLAVLFVFDRGLFFLVHGFEKDFYKTRGLRSIFWKKRDFNKHFLELPKGTYSTLIMGSSRTHQGIHPQYFAGQLKENAFKVAKAKARIKFNYYFYHEYKKVAGVPKVLIYGLDYFMFRKRSNAAFMDVVTGKNSGHAGYKKGPLLLVSNKETIDLFFNDVLEKISKRFARTLSPHRVTFKVIDPFIGYGGKEPLDKGNPGRFDRFDYEPYPGEEGIYFTRLLEDLHADGVTVILVYLPDYIGTYESNAQRERFRGDIRKLTGGYSNVFIYDYNHPDRFSLEKEEYFCDGGYGKTNSHLSITGGRVFNRRFLKDIKKYYQKGK